MLDLGLDACTHSGCVAEFLDELRESLPYLRSVRVCTRGVLRTSNLDDIPGMAPNVQTWGVRAPMARALLKSTTITRLTTTTTPQHKLVSAQACYVGTPGLCGMPSNASKTESESLAMTTALGARRPKMHCTSCTNVEAISMLPTRLSKDKLRQTTTSRDQADVRAFCYMAGGIRAWENRIMSKW